MSRPLPLALLAAVATAPLSAAPQEPLPSALRDHALLGRLSLHPAGDYTPFFLYLEEPPTPDPEHLATVQALYGPWLQELGTLFLEEFVVPGSLRLDEDPLLPVVVLSKGATFQNAKRYEEEPSHLSSRVLVLGAAGNAAGTQWALVTQWDSSLSRVPDAQLRTPVLYRAVETLIAAHHRGVRRLPVESWVVEGLAGYLSGNEEGMEPDDLEKPPVPPGPMTRLKVHLEDPDRRAALILSLEELATTHGSNQRFSLLRRRAASVDVELGLEEALQIVRDQAALWMHFLDRGDRGRRSEGLRRYVARVLRDEGSLAELAATFGVDDLAELDVAFSAHLDLLLGGGDVASAVPVVEEGQVFVEDLITGEHTTEERIAAALGRAARGNLTVALQRLEAALAGTETPEERERLTAELERVRVALEARESFLASLVEDKRKLRLTVGGESVVADVEAYEGGVATLRSNKAELASVAADELAAGDLARSMGNDASKHGPQWLAPYLLLLAEDPQWDRKLDVDDPAGAALAAAAPALASLVHEGVANAELGAIARTPLPGAPFEADAAIARVRALLEGHGDTLAVANVREELAKYVREAWGVIYDTRGLENLVSGELSMEDDGRVRIVYEFEKPEEAEDFGVSGDYLAERTAQVFALQTPKEDHGVAVRGGNLEGVGHVVLRHPVLLEAPITVRYELLYGRSRAGAGLASAILGICDDEAESFVAAWDVFDLECIDKPTGFVGSDYQDEARQVTPARTYEVELRHDGERAELWVDGKKHREVAAAARRSGALFFCIHSDVTMALRRLEIEGRVPRGSASAARESWIDAQVSTMGLGG